jgi:hypothetical protein
MEDSTSRRMEFSLRFNQPESNHLLIKYKLLLYNILHIKNRFFNLPKILKPRLMFIDPKNIRR